MTRRIFIDTEWTAPPWSDQYGLMWIGLADEDGHSWYGISSEVVIDPTTNPFVSGAFRLIDPNEPRLDRTQLASAVVNFCGCVDEFWAWIPTLERFKEWSGLSENAAEAYVKSRNVDLQMLRALVDPWPAGWPNHLEDLNTAAVAAGVAVPLRTPNHLHPRVHVEWNRELFRRIWESGGAGTQGGVRSRCYAAAELR